MSSQSSSVHREVHLSGYKKDLPLLTLIEINETRESVGTNDMLCCMLCMFQKGTEMNERYKECCKNEKEERIDGMRGVGLLLFLFPPFL